MKFKIATFNVNSIRARIPIVISWLNTHRPDVLCLQETKTPDSDFPEEDFKKAGWNVVFKGEKSYNGVAIVSREKPLAVRFGFDKDPKDETRLVYARFGILHIVNTYVPQGRSIDHQMYRYKLEWLARLRDFFEKHFRRSDILCWCGDMNIAPTEIDIYNAEKQKKHVCFHIEARNAFNRVIEWGFVDVFRKHHPEAGWYTFFDYRVPNSVKRNMGWRVDHIFATEPLASKSIEANIDLEPRKGKNPSDHTFLYAVFSI